MKKDRKNLRWGYSTGACAAAAAKAAWIRLTRGGAPQSIWVHFLDGRERELPLLQSGAGHMAAIRKNGGDDPDCTHGATLYADIRACLSEKSARTMSSRSGTAR
ncbi:MAG: cobalt-precorrin-5B (C(1))-methyltransferase [Bilophila wadsworthia]